MQHLAPDQLVTADQIGKRLRDVLPPYCHREIHELERRTREADEGVVRGAFFELRALNTVKDTVLAASELEHRFDELDGMGVDLWCPDTSFAVEFQSTRCEVFGGAFIPEHFSDAQQRQALERDGIGYGDDVIARRARSITESVARKCKDKRFDKLDGPVWLIVEADSDWLENEFKNAHARICRLFSRSFLGYPMVRVALAECDIDRISRLVVLCRDDGARRENEAELQSVFSTTICVA